MDENQDKPKDPAAELPEAEVPLLPELTKTPKQMYFELLRIWVQQAQMQQQIQAYFPYYLMNNYPQLFQTPNGVPGAPAAGLPGALPSTGSAAANGQVANTNQPNVPAGPNQRRLAEIMDPARQEEIINRNGGYEYVIAPIWKRFVAEAIDIVIIFLLKVMTIMAFIDAFDMDFFSLDIDFDTLRNSIEEDYTELLSLTSEFIFLEVITKLVVCLYETLWTIHGQGQIGGATPGKMLMGIRIVHVEAVVLLDPPQPGLAMNNQNPIKALLFPATNPGFKRALCRSVAKNALLTLFFPICFLMFFFKHNRTMYDIMTKTIVVEDNPAPILRRR
ncbi:protein FAM8A1 [Uranotaenia lowii]|uniref:protein FAM8A1 n=1 Tax=Uranotaenia lowii TaxID=190385 RepID=UPI00247A6CB4|nr:protein FAM8A1 [Uranotaenia lowii]